MIIFLLLFEAVLPSGQARHALHSHAARPLVSSIPSASTRFTPSTLAPS